MEFKRFIYFEDPGGSVIGAMLETADTSYDVAAIKIIAWQLPSGRWCRSSPEAAEVDVDMKRVNNLRYFDNYEEFIAEFFTELL